MAVFRYEISHRWERARVLQEFRAGLLSRESICDADFLLRAAARHHGVAAPTACPVCESDQLRMTTWVYGEDLGRRSGSARTMKEIEEFVSDGLIFTVHWVEVCLSCWWNHLIRGATATFK